MGIIKRLIPSVQDSFQTIWTWLQLQIVGKCFGIEAERTAHRVARLKENRVFSHPFGDTHPVNGVWAEAGASVTRFVMLARVILKPTPKVRRITTFYFPLGCRNVQRTVAYVFDGVVNDDLNKMAAALQPQTEAGSRPIGRLH